EAWLTLRAQAQRLGIKVVRHTAGDRAGFGGARVDVLAPPAGYLARSRVSNDDSLVLRLAFGENAFLLTGDVEKRMEQRMVDDGVVAHADVLKVSHHGSRTSTTPALLGLVHPAFAVISAGDANQF